ncbi:hypothetical protein WJX74_004573 [Apatococcus lobatus]|uniref:Glutathione S-transferase n=1 Tax=Apatococcus lobatus TaxID=904363 RepID=A0AAW1RYF4_9CHLO
MSDLHLYHLPGTRSSIIYWLLKELQLDFTVHTFKNRAEVKSAENLERNPLGRVPTFSDKHGTLYESGAILQWILRQYSGGRLQPDASDLAGQQKLLQWCWFAESDLGAYNTLINLHTAVLPEDQRVSEVVPVAKGRVADGLRVLEKTLALQKTDFILGSQLTAADIMIGQAIKNAKNHGTLGAYPNLSAYSEKLMSRPAFQEAYNL